MPVIKTEQRVDVKDGDVTKPEFVATKRWPGQIPYEADSDFARQHIHEFNSQIGKLVFVPRKDSGQEADYVSFEKGRGHCSVGMAGGKQVLNYTTDNLNTILHEMCHCVGLGHEQFHSEWPGKELLENSKVNLPSGVNPEEATAGPSTSGLSQRPRARASSFDKPVKRGSTLTDVSPDSVPKPVGPSTGDARSSFRGRRGSLDFGISKGPTPQAPIFKDPQRTIASIEFEENQPHHQDYGRYDKNSVTLYHGSVLFAEDKQGKDEYDRLGQRSSLEDGRLAEGDKQAVRSLCSKCPDIEPAKTGQVCNGEIVSVGNRTAFQRAGSKVYSHNLTAENSLELGKSYSISYPGGVQKVKESHQVEHSKNCCVIL